jgi:hypothetical protein
MYNFKFYFLIKFPHNGGGNPPPPPNTEFDPEVFWWEMCELTYMRGRR